MQCLSVSDKGFTGMGCGEAKKNKYRPEIDGLRAFAVVAVIINHFSKDLLPSGYLGVDIFFVISGYVITSSLVGRKSNNFLDFVTAFYERRIKRLVPALVIFVLLTSLLISLFNPNTATAMRTGWRSLFGVSNIFLYSSASDYFAPSIALNPFTHTWSLAVEEQFYLLFPFLIYFSGFSQQTAKGARNLFLWLAALTVASLVCFIYLYPVNQPAAYFLMPPRFWEMASGSLIFIAFLKRSKIEQVLEKVSPLLVMLAIIGVLFLPVSAAVPATIGIVILTAVLLGSLKKGTSVYHFFTLKKVVYVGLISYSLYLWHWTVLCISRWTIGIHWWSALFQLVLMFLLAMASYKYIETPFRTHFKLKRFAVFLVGFASIIATALVVKSGNSSLKFAYAGNRDAYYWASYGDFGSQESNPENKPASKEILIIGNSHAKQLLPLAKHISMQNSLSYTIIGTSVKAIPSINGSFVSIDKSSDVPSGLNEFEKIPDSSVHSWQDIGIDLEVENAIQRLKQGDILVLSSRLWSLYKRPFDLNGKLTYKTLKDDNYSPLDRRSVGIFWKAKMENIIRAATLKGVNVIFFSPYPEFNDQLEIAELCTAEWFRPAISEKCYLKQPRSPMLNDRFVPEFESILQELESEFDGFHVFNTFDPLCPLGQDFCESGNESGRLFFDNDHLNVRGVTLLSKHFNKFLHTRSLVSTSV